MSKNFNPFAKIGLLANGIDGLSYLVYSFLSPTLGYLFFGTTDFWLGSIQVLSLFLASQLLGIGITSLFYNFPIIFNYSMSLKAAIVASIGSIGIALLPTYHELGNTAAVLFILLVFVQGIAREWLLSVCIPLNFNFPTYIRLSVISTLSITAIIIASSLASVFAYCVSQQALQMWGWRLPFLLKAPFLLGIPFLISMALRTLPPIPAEAHPPSQTPLKQLILGSSLTAIITSIIYTGLLYLPLYLTYCLNYSSKHIYLIHAITLLSLLLGDRLYRNYNYFFKASTLTIFSFLILVCLPYPLFIILQNTDWIGLIIILFLLQLPIAILSFHLGELEYLLFKDVRSMTIASSIGVTLGSTIPLLILLNTPLHRLAPAFYLISLGSLGLLAMLFYKPIDHPQINASQE